MNYAEDDQPMNIGHKVLIESDVPGVIVCDFDSWNALPGYEELLSKETLVGGGHLTSGVMVRTEKMGLVHFPCPDNGIKRVL